MNLTTKGRYAVMALVDLSLHSDEGPVKLALIAERQQIALNYLEQLFVPLRKSGIVTSVRGPGGGYMLAEDAGDIRISDIITAVDEPIKMTRCTTQNHTGCMHDKTQCATHALWDGLGKHIHQYLQSITLADVCEKRVPMAMPQFNEVAVYA